MKLNKAVNPNTRYLTALTLYANYAFQGIATIILAQQLTSLMAQLNTDQRGITTVISVVGWGRLITVLFIGALSDRYGRKPIILVGMACYVIFFGGILISTNIWAASFFALFAGVANSFLDTGTYPALAELFPKSAGPATVLLRSFITIGQFSLPFLVTFLVANDLYFGYSFILMIALIMINGLIIFKRTITSENLEQVITENSSSNQPKVTTSFSEKSKFMIEGIGLIILGFTAVATFSIIVTWLPLFAQEVSGMSEIDALRLVSIYSFTAFISIFVTSTLVKTVFKPVSVLLIYTSISLLALITLQLNPTPMMNIVLTEHITGGTGFMRSLKESNVDVIGKKMTIIGAGGAATAICIQAALDGVKEISIFNRQDEHFKNAIDVAPRFSRIRCYLQTRPNKIIRNGKGSRM